MRRFITISATHQVSMAATVVTAAVAILLAGSPAVAAKSSSAASRSQQAAQLLTAGDLADHPDQYYGERVSVTAPVEDVFSRTTFALDEDKIWSTGRDLLVLNPSPTGRLTSGTDVTVVGTLHHFTRAEIERMYHPWVWDISPELIVRFNERPVLIASSIRTEDGEQMVRGPAIVPGETATANARTNERDGQADERHDTNGASEVESMGDPLAARPAAIVSAGDLSDHPDRYYGRWVSVTADVEDIYSRTVFALDEDKLWSTGEDVLLVASDLKCAVNGDMYVSVLGEVVHFDEADIERRVPGYAFDLQPDLMTVFNDRPVIIATSIRTADGKELMNESGT